MGLMTCAVVFSDTPLMHGFLDNLIKSRNKHQAIHDFFTHHAKANRRFTYIYDKWHENTPQEVHEFWLFNAFNVLTKHVVNKKDGRFYFYNSLPSVFDWSSCVYCTKTDDKNACIIRIEDPKTISKTDLVVCSNGDYCSPNYEVLIKTLEENDFCELNENIRTYDAVIYIRKPMAEVSIPFKRKLSTNNMRPLRHYGFQYKGEGVLLAGGNESRLKFRVKPSINNLTISLRIVPYLKYCNNILNKTLCISVNNKKLPDQTIINRKEKFLKVRIPKKLNINDTFVIALKIKEFHPDKKIAFYEKNSMFAYILNSIEITEGGHKKRLPKV
jgi:hypothetical protein